ncbi:MAG: tRNA uridine(34) 5-carboxymethylaminomethyl modification radical SAM/GNAT enzyme Elp3 [Coriobacteriia bacterium]|nr:tRNA uridine(34) 5-carboxymethylaminomethyl modification radical SAM/GNAT enzyme Elp3 [Coriobacteriia bacterium]
MELILLEIIKELKAGGSFDEQSIAYTINRHNKLRAPEEKNYAKKRLLPYYLKVKETEPERWERWSVDPATERRLFALLQMKPRRTASGVATLTVMTKPWKCTSDCIYCPNDVRMPKSYLCDEPACQRAERNYFDPYLQVTSRLRALTQMGHLTGKVELIVLGGTWSDYPVTYQTWFITELFRALNDGAQGEENVKAKRAGYQKMGLTSLREEVDARVCAQQGLIRDGETTFNQAIEKLYMEDEAWQRASATQSADFAELEAAQRVNENAPHRVVGLVVETRPDTITARNLTLLRRFGCTKVQMGIQSLDEAILRANHRDISVERITEAFELLRVFGFKIHAHFMVNLYGSTPEKDKRDFLRFVSEASFLPDEIKIYPCSLVAGTGLCARYDDRTWRPYTEDELLDVLVTDTLNTPSYMRISRMIRDISAHDIVVGNKKANMRQMVEARIEASGAEISEIRYREVSLGEVDVQNLVLDEVSYATSNTREIFLQWMTPENKIAGFLRLSLPDREYLAVHEGEVPVHAGEAMIREVHVYGKVAGLHKTGGGAQHLGLGRRLIERACSLAKNDGFARINVISAVGTREYYRGLGFVDYGMYQQKGL